MQRISQPETEDNIWLKYKYNYNSVLEKKDETWKRIYLYRYNIT